MAAPGELPGAWRALAAELEPYAPSAAEAFCRAAADLEHALRERADEVLTLKAASEESGYSKRRLRGLIAEGRIANAGRKGAPRIRRADLPMKPGKEGKHTGSRYDTESDAAELAGRLT